jgi:hypothetical protein
MSQEDHKLIDDCKTKAKELVAAIEKHKAQAELGQAATNSLQGAAKAIDHVAQHISPLMAYPVKRFIIIFLGIGVLNSVLLIVILILQLIK